MLGEWCIPHMFRDNLAIRRGLRRLIGNGINLATSTCYSRFFLLLHKEAAMPHQIVRGCSSRVFDSSTPNGVKNGGVVAKKLALLFHILSKSRIICLGK